MGIPLTVLNLPELFHLSPRMRAMRRAPYLHLNGFPIRVLLGIELPSAPRDPKRRCQALRPDSSLQVNMLQRTLWSNGTQSHFRYMPLRRSYMQGPLAQGCLPRTSAIGDQNQYTLWPYWTSVIIMTIIRYYDSAFLTLEDALQIHENTHWERQHNRKYNITNKNTNK